MRLWSRQVIVALVAWLGIFVGGLLLARLWHLFLAEASRMGVEPVPGMYAEAIATLVLSLLFAAALTRPFLRSGREATRDALRISGASAAGYAASWLVVMLVVLPLMGPLSGLALPWATAAIFATGLAGALVGAFRWSDSPATLPG